MTDLLKKDIREALRECADGTLKERAARLLGVLGYESERTWGVESVSEFLGVFNADDMLTERQRELFEPWRGVDIVFQYTEEELSAQNELLRQDLLGRQGLEQGRAESFLFLAVDLESGDYARHRLAAMTRAVNRLFPMPVIVFYRYVRGIAAHPNQTGPNGATALSVAVIHRRAHKRDADRDVLEKVTLVKDIRVSDPHRAHIEILGDLALQRMADARVERSFDTLHAGWEEQLDTEELNKRFYLDLFAWFQRAVGECGRCGFSPAARHTVFTKPCVVPAAFAIDRHDQCVASGGFSCVVRRMISVLSAACAFGHLPPWLPPRGRSFSIPFMPSSAYRRRQRLTLSLLVRSSRAMAVFVIPSEAISTICDRSRCRTVALRDRDHRSGISRSPSATSISTAFRMAPSLSVPLDSARRRSITRTAMLLTGYNADTTLASRPATCASPKAPRSRPAIQSGRSVCGGIRTSLEHAAWDVGRLEGTVSRFLTTTNRWGYPKVLRWLVPFPTEGTRHIRDPWTSER